MLLTTITTLATVSSDDKVTIGLMSLLVGIIVVPFTINRVYYMWKHGNK